MPHEGLQRPGVDTSPCKGIASAMAQHVNVDREGQSGSFAKPFNELLGAIRWTEVRRAR